MRFARVAIYFSPSAYCVSDPEKFERLRFQFYWRFYKWPLRRNGIMNEFGTRKTNTRCEILTDK